MAVDNPAFIDAALQVYIVEVHKAIKAQQEQLQQLRAVHDKLQRTIETVRELPIKLRHQVMVPFGRHAFFPGQLTRTNELMVHLGEHYYVEATAAAVAAILRRKLGVLTEGTNKGQQQLRALRARLDATRTGLKDDSAEEEPIEIRSTLEESDALLNGSSRKSRVQPVQQQQSAERVRSAAGYSHTPLAACQGSQQVQPSAEDAAIQARLEELLRLEELQEGLPVDEQQQQQLQQQHSLPTIKEDEEGSSNDEPEQASQASSSQVTITAPAAATAASATAQVRISTTQLVAMQHLQQLEAASDSDDEDQQQHAASQAAASNRCTAVDQAAQMSPAGRCEQFGTEQQSQPQQPESYQSGASKDGVAATTAAAPLFEPASGGRTAAPALKSILKKGFLSAHKPSSSSTSTSQVGDKSPSHSQQQTNSSNSSTVKRSQTTAFTGEVVERPAVDVVPLLAAPLSSVRPPMSEVAVRAVGGSTGASRDVASSSSSGSRPSKFMLRRKGIGLFED